MYKNKKYTQEVYILGYRIAKHNDILTDIPLDLFIILLINCFKIQKVSSDKDIDIQDIKKIFVFFD